MSVADLGPAPGTANGLHDKRLQDQGVEVPKSTTRSLIVIRHGRRLDDDQPNWQATAKRPWDVPLAELGREQAAKAGQALRELDIAVVVTSPYLRCLQTSAAIVKELDLPQGSWFVDWSFGEVGNPPQLLGHSNMWLLEEMRDRTIDSWFWDPYSPETVLQMFAATEEACIQSKQVPVMYPGSHAPSVPESHYEASERYTAAFKVGFLKLKFKKPLRQGQGTATAQQSTPAAQVPTRGPCYRLATSD
eukprot:gene26951-34977_t